MASNSPFAVVASGHLVQANFTTEDGEFFSLVLPNVGIVDHLAVFLTGSIFFPDDKAGSIYIRFQSAPDNWLYLGMLSNQKPSAFFRISNVNRKDSTISHINRPLQPDGFSESNEEAAEILIHIESAVIANGRVGDKQVSVSPNNFLAFQQKMVKSFVNFASSFVRSFPTEMGNIGQFVPVEVVTQWYDKFSKKLEINPNFWVNIHDD
uniref:Hikeshi-like domain-containing protein n=1 Tax=Panagrolaimus sp. JU765 TaxID=591449 RepID=A0AC34PUE0_9BILA